MNYSHLTQYQRSQIQVLKSMGHRQCEIAIQIGVHASTISREIKRNKGGSGYRHQQAQKLADNRRREASCSPRKMTKDVITFIEDDN